MSDLVIEGNTLVDYLGNGERVDIPEGVVKIDAGVFMDCDLLEKVFMPKSLRVIDAKAFKGCTSLKRVYIPSKLDYIGDSAFESCSSLKDMALFKPVDKIGSNAFEGTPWLDSVRKKKGCMVIGDILVDGRTYSKYHALRIQSGIKVIAPMAFKGNRNLMKVTLEYGVVSIGANAFCDCGMLDEIIIPKSVAEIGCGAFNETPWIREKRLEGDYITVNDIIIDAKNFTSSVLTLPSKIKAISDCAFADNEHITKVVMHDGVRKIGKYAFFGCKNLQSVILPDSIAECGKYAFRDCCNVLITYKGKSYSANSFDEIWR